MTDFDAAAHLAHMESVMGLTVRPEWRAGVEANLKVAARMAEIVMAEPLDDHVEPANTFEADR